MEQLVVSSGNRYGGKPENQPDASDASQTLFSAGVITMHLVADRFFHLLVRQSGTGSLAGIKLSFLFSGNGACPGHTILYTDKSFSAS